MCPDSSVVQGLELDAHFLSPQLGLQTASRYLIMLPVTWSNWSPRGTPIYSIL